MSTRHGLTCLCDKCQNEIRERKRAQAQSVPHAGSWLSCLCKQCEVMRQQTRQQACTQTPPKPIAPSLPHAKATFDRAYSLIGGDRRDAYGDAHSSFARIALTWSGVLGATVTAQQVALCMIALKLCREANGHKQDSIDDMCGYAGLLAELAAATNPTATGAP